MSVWSPITELLGAQGVKAAWGDFPAQFLTVVDRLAAAIPCDRGHPCQMRIAEHGPDDFVGICSNEDGFCGKRQVRKNERIVYRLDEGKLFDALLKSIGGMPVMLEEIIPRPRVLRIGGIPTTGDSEVWVFFALASDPTTVDAAVTALLARRVERFLLVVPEEKIIGIVQQNWAVLRKGIIVGLDQLFELTDKGGVSVRSNGQDVVRKWMEKIAPKASRDAESARFSTPPGTEWKEVKITFLDRDMLAIKCGKQSEVTKQREQIPGMTNSTTQLNTPSVNWLLLKAFAINGPAVSMSDLMKMFPGHNSGALRRRKSYLSQILQDYFGINGDPIPYDQRQRCYLLRIVLSQADNTELDRRLENARR